MEDVDCLETVVVVGVMPIGNVMNRLLDEVLEFPVPNFGIEYLFHVSFFFSVDFHRWWR